MLATHITSLWFPFQSPCYTNVLTTSALSYCVVHISAKLQPDNQPVSCTSLGNKKSGFCGSDMVREPYVASGKGGCFSQRGGCYLGVAYISTIIRNSRGGFYVTTLRIGLEHFTPLRTHSNRALAAPNAKRWAPMICDFVISLFCMHCCRLFLLTLALDQSLNTTGHARKYMNHKPRAVGGAPTFWER
jgi:hypothetical protein